MQKSSLSEFEVTETQLQLSKSWKLSETKGKLQEPAQLSRPSGVGAGNVNAVCILSPSLADVSPPILFYCRQVYAT